METVTHPAVELYRLAAGTDLTADAAAALERMLATGPDGKFTDREVHTYDRSVVEARVLAGLFLLDENVVWTFHRGTSLREAFRRMATLADSEALRPAVAHIRHANGNERIELRTGHRLTFVPRAHGRGARGFSADLYVFDEALDGPSSMRAEERASALIVGASRPNPQLVSCL